MPEKSAKSSSDAQQRFFGLVRAVQKGDVPPSKVTSNVRQAAKDTSAKDAHDLATKKEKGAPERIMAKDKKNEDVGLGQGPQTQPNSQRGQGISFFDVVGKYNEYGDLLKRDRTLSELAQQLSDIAEYAEYALTNETNDWFDKHTISRNIKEMQSYAKEFQKVALEADSHQQRMTGLYDDMGRILERYFDIYDQQHESDGSRGVMGSGQKTYGVMGSDDEPMEAAPPVQEPEHDETSCVKCGEPTHMRNGDSLCSSCRAQSNADRPSYMETVDKYSVDEADRRSPEPHFGNDEHYGEPDRRQSDRRTPEPHYGNHAQFGEPDRRKHDPIHRGPRNGTRRDWQVEQISKLTERAISIARIKMNEVDGPAFDSLPRQTQASVAWRIVSRNSE